MRHERERDRIQRDGNQRNGSQRRRPRGPGGSFPAAPRPHGRPRATGAHDAGRRRPRTSRARSGRCSRFMGPLQACCSSWCSPSPSGPPSSTSWAPRCSPRPPPSSSTASCAKIDGSGGIDLRPRGADPRCSRWGCTCCRAACSFVQGWIMSVRVAAHLLPAAAGASRRRSTACPCGYFERTSTGDTLSRITNDVDTLGQSLNQGVTPAHHVHRPPSSAC